MTVVKKCELRNISCFQFQQQLSSFSDVESKLPGLGENSNEPELRNRTGRQSGNSDYLKSVHPSCHPLMETVLEYPKSQQSIHV